MRFLFFNILGFLLAGAGLAVVGAAPFVAPADGNAPFRRDRLPISVETMGDLSGSLAILPQEGKLFSARRRRAAAQALALALALAPENETALEFIEILGNGENLPAVDSGRATAAKARIWQIHAWLTTAEAGVDGNLLASLMGDSISVLDSDHPAAEAMREAGEAGKWDGWVAPVSDFEKEEIAEKVPEPVAGNEMTDEEEAPDRPVFKLKEGQLGAVTFQAVKGKKNLYRLAPATLSMKAETRSKVEGEDGEFQVRIESLSPREGGRDTRAEKEVRDWVKKLHGELPKWGLTTVSSAPGDRNSFRRNGDGITGPAFILVNSAISGKAVAATVIGKLDKNGELVLPDFFWRDLLALKDGPGGKLVLPIDAYEFLEGFLALEMPEFFLKYEVLLAKDKEEFIRLCAAEPSEEDARVFGRFQEVRERSEGKLVGSYLANKFVRQRLVDLAGNASYHASARLLAIQGAGERPRVLSRKLLAAEIWRFIEPVKDVGNMRGYEVIAPGANAELEKLYDDLRENLGGLDRYADSGDKDLLKSAEDFASSLRDLIRAGSKVDLFQRQTDMNEALKDITAGNKALRKTLSEITGDSLSE